MSHAILHILLDLRRDLDCTIYLIQDHAWRSCCLSAADLLAALVVKLPSFWLVNIETWLVQSESQFCLKGVTCSQTKFDYVVQVISRLTQSRSLISSDLLLPPYQHLMNWLLRMYALACML